MLTKIAVADLRLGMHLHRFDGAWIDHPFWRVRFVIDDAADLLAAQSSGVRECWIDTERGLDRNPTAAVESGCEPESLTIRAPIAPAASAGSEATSLADELRCAGARVPR